MQQKIENIFNYLNKKTTFGQQKEIENWISEDSENVNIFDEVKKLYNITSLEDENFSPQEDKAWNKVSKKLFETKKDKVVQINFGFVMKIAAMLTLILGLGYFYFINQNTPAQTVITTVANQIKQIELVDGTKVWINENSTFKYLKEFTSKNREVYLNGEAYFEVAKNPAKPFIIHSKNTFTQVLGTSFNLNTNEDISEINVVSGKVTLVLNSDKNNKVVLLKGERGLLLDGQVEKSAFFNANTMAWKTKKIVFKSTELKKVVKVLQDFYNIEIELNKNISNCLITSTFDNKPVEEIFKVLNIIAKIDNIQIDSVYHLSGVGC